MSDTTIDRLRETMELARQVRWVRLRLTQRTLREGWREVRTPRPGLGGRRPFEAIAPDAVVLAILAGPRRKVGPD